MSFQEFGLSETAVHGAQRIGYVDPSPIQERAIPIILSKKDLVGSAQTGTGKTAAFGLPLISLLGWHESTRCLVLEPTRELAMQVEEAFRDFSYFTDLEIALIHGGVGYGKQEKALKSGADVVVATPGRLIDHMEQGTLSLKGIEYLVLDEVDRMLDMGFLPAVRKIIERCPKERQTLMFSATIPEEIDRLSSWALRNPEKIEIGIRKSPAETVTHAFYPVGLDQKFELVCELLERTHYESVLIFTRTKDGADRVSNRLKSINHSVAVLHSNRSQSERTEALAGFKSGKYEVMVATDIAARGLDVQGVSHVINYDIPTHPEDYVHRIGRTGRAQAEGDAFTIITTEDLTHVQAIENFIGQKILREKLENFPYKYSTIFDEGKAKTAAKKARKAGTVSPAGFRRRRRR